MNTLDNIEIFPQIKIFLIMALKRSKSLIIVYEKIVLKNLKLVVFQIVRLKMGSWHGKCYAIAFAQQNKAILK